MSHSVYNKILNRGARLNREIVDQNNNPDTVWTFILSSLKFRSKFTIQCLKASNLRPLNIFLIIPVLLAFFALFADAAPLSLQDAVNSALKQNPDIASYKAAWESAKAKIPQTLSLDDPKIGIEYEQAESLSNLESGMKMYTASQMIMFPGKIYAKYQMAAASAQMWEYRYKSKKLEILNETKSLYYNLFFLDRAITIMKDVKNYLSRIKKVAEAKYVIGSVMQSDMLQANIEYLLANNELTNLEQERSAKESKLKAFMGVNDNNIIETDSSLEVLATLESLSSLRDLALENRPELLAMKAEIAMKDYSHLDSKMEFFPDIDLGVKNRVGDGWDAMASISIPLYFWKQGYSFSSAGFEREMAEATFRNMVNMTSWEVTESYVMAESAKRTFLLYEESIVPQSLQALNVALTAYQSGKTDFQTLLQLERMYKESKLKLYENQVSLGKAIAWLERITGKEMGR